MENQPTNTTNALVVGSRAAERLEEYPGMLFQQQGVKEVLTTTEDIQEGDGKP